jgi:hypothetical protein
MDTVQFETLWMPEALADPTERLCRGVVPTTRPLESICGVAGRQLLSFESAGKSPVLFALIVTRSTFATNVLGRTCMSR